MPKVQRRPLRTCVACRQEAAKADLVRLVRRPDGSVEADASGRLSGRGAYIHRTKECLENARKKRSLERALKASLTAELWDSLRRDGGLSPSP